MAREFTGSADVPGVTLGVEAEMVAEMCHSRESVDRSTVAAHEVRDATLQLVEGVNALRDELQEFNGLLRQMIESTRASTTAMEQHRDRMDRIRESADRLRDRMERP